jgi:hypothetical protein
VNAVAELELWDSTRAFRLPGADTPSMLFRFEDAEGRPLLGVRASTGSGDFEPGARFESVRLWFWADEAARSVVVPGARFVVWYGGDVGEGVIRRCEETS